MKTRVVRRWVEKLGRELFDVQKWALWDDPELRRYYPKDFNWRYVTSFGLPAEAITHAERLAAHEPESAETTVVWSSE